MMKKIMVVDDDSTILELLQSRLEHNAYQVQTATDGVQALAQIRDNPPDLIILDACMPQMDGLKFVDEIRWNTHLRSIPVLVLTGQPKSRPAFMELGVRWVMTKPFEASLLVKRVDMILQMRSVPCRKQVMVIDDDPDIVELIETRLRVNDYDVITAENGATALHQIKDVQPDAIVLDIMMPDMDGFQVCQTLKSDTRCRDIPIIVLSGLTSKSDRKMVRQIKADAYLPKPFQAAQLLETVNQLAKG